MPIDTSHITVGTSAVKLTADGVPARASDSLTIRVISGEIFVGASDVAVGTGFAITATDGPVSFSLGLERDIYAISAGSVSVHRYESTAS